MSETLAWMFSFQLLILFNVLYLFFLFLHNYMTGNIALLWYDWNWMLTIGENQPELPSDKGSNWSRGSPPLNVADITCIWSLIPIVLTKVPQTSILLFIPPKQIHLSNSAKCFHIHPTVSTSVLTKCLFKWIMLFTDIDRNNN